VEISGVCLPIYQNAVVAGRPFTAAQLVSAGIEMRVNFLQRLFHLIRSFIQKQYPLAVD
jgi:hypothetical protein